MDKLVYLYELDSVHDSPREILRGQQALFEEIVLNGNQVVLTFNQLTDSQAFLSAIRDPASYPYMLELFHLGAIKISRFAPPGYDKALGEERRQALQADLAECRGRYGELFQNGALKSYPPLPDKAPQRVLRTASHYVQTAVEKCLNDSGDSFLFSALPFRSGDKAVLAAISYALQYSDPSVLDTCSFLFPEDGPAAGDREGERRDYVKRYVEMILRLSREPLAANPEKTEAFPTFTQMLDQIDRACAGLPPAAVEDDEVLARLPEALALLGAIRAEFAAGEVPPNNRSNWHHALAGRRGEPVTWLAEAVVDLCYNYTMEASIAGVSRHYWDGDSFRTDFLCRLRLYWRDFRQGIHQFRKGDRRTLAGDIPGRLPHWDTAVRLLKTAPAGSAGTAVEGGVYEASTAGEKRIWYRRIGASLLRQVWAAFLYFLLFLGTSFALEVLEGWLTAFGGQIQINEVLLSLVNIFLFGLLGSLLSVVSKLPDILDNTRAFFCTLLDGVRLLRAPRRVAYLKGREGL